jgi:hypothetical protein
MEGGDGRIMFGASLGKVNETLSEKRTKKTSSITVLVSTVTFCLLWTI